MFYFLIFAFGACVGSFLNAWIWRLHRGESVVKGRRSYCPKCTKQLKNFDLVPVFSFLFLGGKCRFCKKKISLQYPLVEIAVGVFYLLAFFAVMNRFSSGVGRQIYLFLYWYFIAILVVVFVFDLKYYLILDKVTIPAMILIFLVNLFLGAGFLNLALGVFIGAGFFGLQYYVSSGKWVGGGDIRLGALIGCMFGWQKLFMVLFVAYISGAVFSLWLIFARGRKMESKIPFGTFLSGAAVVVLLWGDHILAFYDKIVRAY